MNNAELITGFPNTLLSRKVLQKRLQDDPNVQFYCVVPEEKMWQATRFVDALSPSDRKRITTLTGDPTAIDLGLSGKEYLDLVEKVSVIHHCSISTDPAMDRATAMKTNVASAREIAEMIPNTARLEKIVFWSTALVAGKRTGRVLEEELTDSSSFRNPMEESCFRAERLIREHSRGANVVILRPSVIVGDSKTGEIDRFDGPYLLVLLFLSSQTEWKLPVLGTRDLSLHLIPIDYVVETGLHIAFHPSSNGRTFHIVDPRPCTTREVFEKIAAAAGRSAPRGFLPTQLATTLMRIPGLERFAQAPRAFMELLSTDVVYDDRNTRELLADTELRCPSFDSYVPTLVRYVRNRQEERGATPLVAGDLR